MAGMGRGMPNNMQQMAMANQMGAQMGGQMPTQMGGQMARGMSQQLAGQSNLSTPSVQQHIFEMLNAQGPFTGWQANVHVRERAAQIKLLVDSLRLVRPPVDLPRAIEVALQFERKCFTQSTSREDYIRECSEKLGRIRDQRAQQMNQGVAGMMPGMQGMQMQGMQMPNQNFAQMQQQMGQNMNPNMALPPHLQQQMQGSPMFNQPQPMMNQGPPKMNQPQANMVQANNQQKSNPLPELTPEDNKAINLRAAELAKSTPKEEMRTIVEKMNPQLRQNLAQKAVDPIIYYFRMLATKEFRRRKQMEAGMGGTGNVGPMNNNSNMMNQLQNQPNQNGMNQGMNANTNSLIGDMGRFQGQQAEGLRSQEEGQLVVPATSGQGVIPDQMRIQQQMLANQRMGQQNQNNSLNPAFIAQQQRLQQAQATKMQQAQLQAQNQAQAQARAQAAAQAQQMANQRSQMQGMPQSTAPGSLSAINRPVGPNVSGASPQTGPRPSSGTPMMNQQMPMAGGMQQGGPQQISMQDMQKREQALANFPPPLQAILRTKPQSEWRNVLQQFQQSGSMRRSLSQQPQSMQPQQQPGQQQQPQNMAQMQNGAFLGGANIGPMPMQQSLSAGAASQQGQDMGGMQGPQGQIQQNQEMLRQRQMQIQQQQKQQQQQQQQHQSQQQGQPQAPRQQLTPQQMKVMDQQQVPPMVLNNVRQHAPLPDIKSWYQLKQWLIQNPVANWPVGHVLDIQATHFAHLMKNRGQNVQQQNNAMGQPPQPMQHPQIPGVPPGPIPFRPPTQQDVQKVRAANPKLANLPDDKIRALLINRHRQMGMQQQQGQQGMAQQLPFMPPQQGQGNPPGQQFGMQAPNQNQAPSQPNMPAQQQPRPPSGQAPGQPRPSQTPVPPENKALKRPNDDDVIEMPNPALNKPAPPHMDLTKAQQSHQALTKEQFNALDPAKKQQYMNFQRQQAAMRKVMELTKEVQASMPKLRPITNMDQASRRRITMILTSDNVKNMLGRFDSFLIAFYRIESNDAAIKQLVLQKMQLFSQFKPQTLQNRTFEVADHFSITADTAEAIINNITAKFQQTAAQIPQQNKARPQPAQLTPENLSLLEAQEQDRRKSLKANQVPPAPTATQPPFQIGDPRGQGTPRYANAGLKQEDLKLPTDPKRRKKNQQQTATTNAAASATATPSVTTSPQAIKMPKPVETFKCPVNGCEHQLKGFPTQAELNQHHNVAHKLDMEPVTDPLAFLHESLRSAFNLDENLKQIKKTFPTTDNKATVANSIKGESSGATPISMSKIPSQAAGPKAGEPTAPDDDDPWRHSNITLDQLRMAFGGDDWDELFPSQEKTEEYQSKFYEAYRNSGSERWRKIAEGPNGALTDTSTDKSKSPEDVSDKEVPAAAANSEDKKDGQEKKTEEDSWMVNLKGIEGLDLSGLGNTSPFENIGDKDIIMGENGSPFEWIEKPQLTNEELHLQTLGVDLQHPEAWDAQQKALVEFFLDQ
ncbi:uncharacterized protein Z518_04272 [Rhinocladiella mackenziei CBS 650.93]|uniref:Mediator complex subunit 15 KIX domain-containing protein n=1 Tax=Rhinocladiella mackenziei CBS 650.93 TaxID=1442369 RepID=A0A0D2FVW3_9EURO|nr:uncharacterized protein Z518_04272 [Rhinocladiella mackenziei CBS 650.93]KIX06297.1 hypothetical protein Z518_04272 [Rhinocladiella mackenziei CBS 650.93]